MRKRKKGFKKEIWFSICSRHAIYEENCNMCNAGSWNNAIRYKISSLIYDLFPSLWRWWVNRFKNKVNMKNKSTNLVQNPPFCKTDVISSCDCFVGFLSGEKVNKSTIDYEVEKIVNIQPTFKKYGLLNGEPQTKSQIVDGRKGYLSRFVYCPYCGEKVNWKKVLRNCL